MNSFDKKLMQKPLAELTHDNLNRILDVFSEERSIAEEAYSFFYRGQYRGGSNYSDVLENDGYREAFDFFERCEIGGLIIVTAIRAVVASRQASEDVLGAVVQTNVDESVQTLSLKYETDKSLPRTYKEDFVPFVINRAVENRAGIPNEHSVIEATS